MHIFAVTWNMAVLNLISLITVVTLVLAKKKNCHYSYERNGDTQKFRSNCIDITSFKRENKPYFEKVCSGKPECENIVVATGCVNGTYDVKKAFGTEEKSASIDSDGYPDKDVSPSPSAPAESPSLSAPAESSSTSVSVLSSHPPGLITSPSADRKIGGINIGRVYLLMIYL